MEETPNAIPVAPAPAKEKKPRRLTKEQQAKEQAMQVLLAYCQAAKESGCPQDQVINFYRAGITLQPKQLQFAAAARLCDLPDGPNTVAMGGSRGASKSFSIMAQLGADDCQRFSGLKCLLLRKVGKAVKESFDDFRTKLFSRIPHHYAQQRGIMTFDNGSTIIIGHYKNLSDIDAYLGLEYDVIAIEEATTLDFDKYKNILSCLRTSKTGWRPRCYSNSNPGGLGNFWFKQVYVDPWEQKREKETRFIHCTAYDNRFINKEYLAYLESLTGWKRDAWLYGKYDIAVGQFFTNWREDVHVYPNARVQFNEKKAKRWFCSLDHGYAHPTSCHLHAEDIDGIIYTVDEYHQTETVPEENCENIKAMLRRHNLSLNDLDFFAAGKDCFNRNAEGKTISTMYEENGIELVPGETDRLNRWGIMLERLGNPAAGVKPTWYIHRTCKNLIVQIPMAQNSETRPGDIAKMNADENGDFGDDALDDVSVGLATGDTGSIKWAKPMQVGAYRMIGAC